MKYWLIGFAAVVATGLANADEVEDSCRACHRGDLSLGEWVPAELATLVRSMRDGNAEHLVPIPALSDDEVARLAEALAAH